MTRGMTEIETIVSSCAPWEPNDEDYTEQFDYLVSLLSSRRENATRDDSDDDSNELFEIVNEFFDDPEASRKLLNLWLELPKAETTTTSKKVSLTKEGPRNEALETTAPALSETIEATERPAIGTEDKIPMEAPTKKNKSRSPRRERRRRKDKEASSRSKEKKESIKDLRTVVNKIHEASAQDLDATDDFSSAWHDAKDQGRSWGGRGYGGRGVNRGLGTYGGKDAVVQGLTMAYDGKELLRESHLVIAHGHRYGLWGKNGVGKSTLLRRIASASVPGWPLHLSVEMVEQEVIGSDQTVRECVAMAGANSHGRTASPSQNREALEDELAELEVRLAELADGGAESEEIEGVALRISELCEALEDTVDDEQRKEQHSVDSDAGSDQSIGDHRETAATFEGLEDNAIAILKGLSFKASMLDTPIRELSGGWRMKVALVEALCSHPDILLLDEPTNHLDVSATMFLEEYLLQKNLTVVVVSHDGDFLDAICTDMIKFENQKLEYHAGNYSTFREREEQLWKTNNRTADAVARKEAKAMEFISKQKSMSNSKRRDDNKQRQAKEREKKLGRIGLYNTDGKKFKLLSERKGVNMASHIKGAYTNAAGFSSYHVDNSQKAFGEDKQRLRFRFPAAAPLKGATGEFAPLITLDDCRFRYDHGGSTSGSGSETHSQTGGVSEDAPRWLLQDMTLSVSVGSRIGILGKNGSGKSTLVKLLCGELSPDPKAGNLWRHPSLKIAHVSQHHIERLGNHLDKSPVEYFHIHDQQQHHDEERGSENDHQIRQFLGGFGLIGSLALQPIGSLSGGQKARLAFATVLYSPPHVLILDEPTNHLDGESLESLSEALSNFGGALVTVSHNRAFLSQNCREVWTIQTDGRVVSEAVESSETNGNGGGGGGVPFNVLYENYKNSLRKKIPKGQTKERRRTKRT